MDIKKITGQRIKKLRINHEYSQDMLAEKLGMKRASIANYEAGRIMPPGDILLKLAEIFNVSTDFLLGRDIEQNHEIMSMGEILKIERQKRGITQQGLSELTGISQRDISEYERSAKPLPIPVLARLEKVYDDWVQIASEYNLTKVENHVGDHPPYYQLDRGNQNKNDVTIGSKQEEAVKKLRLRDNVPLYKQLLLDALILVDSLSDTEINQNETIFIMVTAYNAFEMRLNELLLKALTAQGHDVTNAFELLKQQSMQMKMHTFLLTYLDYDIKAQDFYQDLYEGINIRNQVAHSYLKVPINKELLSKTVNSVELALDSLNKHTTSRG
ncbi:helix-turn-helix transcriptional regulator [Niallia taxi]|uniref:helix-turn-helix domain-containing protein n=1 Tax=Niallia taxi TaxID=2499688 RepID=UPI002E1D9173|nr:helix-turn-helix transcriptional regulator [Niallia taxi]MED4118101.1 helix-turn-helix transcriptional regulator [Niallia taxi]